MLLWSPSVPLWSLVRFVALVPSSGSKRVEKRVFWLQNFEHCWKLIQTNCDRKFFGHLTVDLLTINFWHPSHSHLPSREEVESLKCKFFAPKVRNFFKIASNPTWSYVFKMLDQPWQSFDALATPISPQGRRGRSET